MRITTSSAFGVLLLTLAPSIGGAQVLSPFSHLRSEPQALAHAVPVATLNLAGDAIALADPHVVNDPAIAPFVLGAASLDLHDPSHAMIVFSIRNAATEPIPWNAVEFSVERAAPVPLEDQAQGAPTLIFCTLAKRGLAAAPNELFQPGATASVQVPISGDCFRKSEAADPLGFLVYVGGEMPHPDLLLGPSDPQWAAFSARRKALLRRAMDELTRNMSQ